MILNVAFISGKLRMDRAFKRRENSFTQISYHIREDIQAAAMGHTKSDVFHAARRRAVNQSIE